MKKILIITLIMILLIDTVLALDFFEGEYSYLDEPITKIDTIKQKLKPICTLNSKTTNNSDGTHTLIIGGLYVDSNCTTFDEAKSVKFSEFGKKYKLIIKEDKKYPLKQKDITDFNATHIIFSPNLNFSEFKKNIEIRVIKKNNVSKIKYKSFIKYKNNNDKKNISVLFGLGDELHIGENSTTITLQINETENLDDTYTWTAYNTNYGNDDKCHLASFPYDTENRTKTSIFKFNLNSIPSYQYIINATLRLEILGNGLDSGESFIAYANHVYKYDNFSVDNVEWNETNIRYNNVPTNSTEYNLTSEDSRLLHSGTSISSKDWIVSQMVNRTYNWEENNITIWINPKLGEYLGTPGTYDDIVIATKEYANTNLRPQLIITYDAIPSNLKYFDNSTSGTKSNSLIKHNLRWTNTIPLSGYIFGLNNGTNITSCIGTLNCSNYTTETNCNNCSECNWNDNTTSYSELEFESFSVTGEPGTNWVSSYINNADCAWIRDNDGTGSSSTGPCDGDSPCATDAGYDDDWYVFVETSGGGCDTSTGHALLTYSNIDMDTYPNMQIYFAYNMYGSTIGTLNVQIDDGDDGWDTLWTKSGAQGTSWIYQNVSLNGYSGIRDIRFDYDRNGESSFTGDIALDILNISSSPFQTSNCVEIGSCSSCSIDECDTNCSAGGCSMGSFEQWIYDAWIPMIGTNNWSNVSKFIDEAIGTTIKWNISANDSNNNWNYSQIYTYITTEGTTPPSSTTFRKRLMII